MTAIDTQAAPAPLTADEARFLDCWRVPDDRRRAFLLAMAELQSSKYPRRARPSLSLVVGGSDDAH